MPFLVIIISEGERKHEKAELTSEFYPSRPDPSRIYQSLLRGKGVKALFYSFLFVSNKPLLWLQAFSKANKVSFLFVVSREDKSKTNVMF